MKSSVFESRRDTEKELRDKQKQLEESIRKLHGQLKPGLDLSLHSSLCSTLHDLRQQLQIVKKKLINLTNGKPLNGYPDSNYEVITQKQQ